MIQGKMFQLIEIIQSTNFGNLIMIQIQTFQFV